MTIRHSKLLLVAIVAIGSGLVLSAAVPQGGPQVFPTPQAAAEALVKATAQNDAVALLKVLGPESKDIVQSGDGTDDQAARVEFVARARAKSQVAPDRDNANRATLVIGDPEWPFPLPLTRDDSG